MPHRLVRNETSAGVIVFRDDPRSRRRWLILLHGKGRWDFAKGHVENGESIRQAALRELAEEAGLPPDQVELVEGFGRSIRYRFVGKGGVRVCKTVHYLLGRSATERVVLSDESEDYAWLELAPCLAQLTFQAARDLLTAAAAFLAAR